jgi:hypothetical protein
MIKKMTKIRKVSPMKKKIAPVQRGGGTGMPKGDMHRMGDGTMMSKSEMKKMMGA